MNVLINIGQGAEKEGKEEVKKATFPTLLTMIVALNNLTLGPPMNSANHQKCVFKFSFKPIGQMNFVFLTGQSWCILISWETTYKQGCI